MGRAYLPSNDPVSGEILNGRVIASRGTQIGVRYQLHIIILCTLHDSQEVMIIPSLLASEHPLSAFAVPDSPCCSRELSPTDIGPYTFFSPPRYCWACLNNCPVSWEFSQQGFLVEVDPITSVIGSRQQLAPVVVIITFPTHAKILF